MSLLEIGQTVCGTYEVERKLGEGAFAEVYRVKHRFLGRQAMKVFKQAGMTIEETEQMLSEALLLSRLGHPNVVRVFDANTTEASRGTLGFFTMEYVAGGSLEQYWRSFGIKFVPVAVTVELIRQVCRGLAVAHAEQPPIVHRDIKPQNILVGYDASGLRAMVSDFGLAKHVNPLTLLASAKGTPKFKGPEAFEDPQSDSRAGDVWSIGTTMYLLLTDKMPYDDRVGVANLDAKMLASPLPPPSSLNMLVDAQLDKIVARCLALNPGERYQNAQQLLDDLLRWHPAREPIHPDGSQSWDGSKSALGSHSPLDETEGRRLASRAIELSRQASQLRAAADLMEEAFNKFPELRQRYESQIKMWRRGISMVVVDRSGDSPAKSCT